MDDCCCRIQRLKIKDRSDRNGCKAKRKQKSSVPTSNGTNFVSLKRVFEDKENLSDYFESTYYQRVQYDGILQRYFE